MTDENGIEDKLYGDLNFDGKVTVDDATVLQRAAVDFVQLTDTQTALADVNGDGRVSVLVGHRQSRSEVLIKKIKTCISAIHVFLF